MSGRGSWAVLLLGCSFFFTVSSLAVAEGEWTIKADDSYLAESHANDMSGDIQINESSTSLEYETKIKEQLPFSFSLNLEHRNIEESLPVELPAHLEGRSVGLGTKFPMPFVDREDVFMGFDMYPSLYTDDWKWESGAFRLPFRSYLIYKPNENFIFVAGTWIKIDYDTPVIPIVGVIYKPTDRLSFNLASDDPNIAYKLTEQWTVFSEFRYFLDEYEVTRGNDKHVVLKYREARAGLGCRFQPNKNFGISLSVGGVGGRRLEYEDDNGKVVPKTTEYARIKASLKF